MVFKLNRTLPKVFWITVIIYSLISFFYFILKSAGGGDESLFINDLELIKNDGWIVAIKKNISIPYMMLVYPFSFFMKNYIALRVVNSILLLVLFFYFYKNKSCKGNLYGYFLFFIATVGYFYSGTNDSLFIICLIVFINEVNNLINDNKWNGTLAISVLIVASFTRELIIVYMPIIFLAIYFIYRVRGWSDIKIFYPLTIFAILLVFNLPSIIEKGEISHDLKSPPSNINATWSQRQYLAQLLVNKGELKNFQHPSWEETETYLAINGENSLPKGVLEGIFIDINLTIKEFFKDLGYSLFFGFRQLGLILVFTIFFLIKDVYSSRGLNNNFFIPISLVIMLIIFSLIIISYVELRWLAPVFLTTIVFYNNYELENKVSLSWQNFNLFILTLLSLYGIYGLLIKIL